MRGGMIGPGPKAMGVDLAVPVARLTPGLAVERPNETFVVTPAGSGRATTNVSSSPAAVTSRRSKGMLCRSARCVFQGIAPPGGGRTEPSVVSMWTSERWKRFCLATDDRCAECVAQERRVVTWVDD